MSSALSSNVLFSGHDTGGCTEHRDDGYGATLKEYPVPYFFDYTPPPKIVAAAVSLPTLTAELRGCAYYCQRLSGLALLPVYILVATFFSRCRYPHAGFPPSIIAAVSDRRNTASVTSFCQLGSKHTCGAIRELTLIHSLGAGWPRY